MLMIAESNEIEYEHSYGKSLYNMQYFQATHTSLHRNISSLMKWSTND